jgi:predicted porin
LTVGRQYSPLDNTWGNFDAQGYTTNSAMGYAWGGVQTQAGGDIGRINNSIMYSMPNMSGFNAQFMYAPGENNNPVTGQGNDQYIGFNVGWGNGPFSTQLAYEGFKKTVVPGVSIRGSRTLETWTIGAQYNFGFMTLYGGFEQAKLDPNTVIGGAGGFKDQGYMIGVKVPIQTMTMNLGYAYEKNKPNGLINAQNGEAWGFGGQITYPLSKRSSLEANFLVGENKDIALFNAFQGKQKNAAYGFGFRTDF